MRKILAGAIPLLLMNTAFCHDPAGARAPYKNPQLPVETRVKDLLKQMTLDEKIAQISGTPPSKDVQDDTFFNNKEKLDSLYGNGIGMSDLDFNVPMEQTINKRNRLQHYLLTQTRLGIPAIFIDEAHHGLVQRDVDVFPHGTGIASSWDTATIRLIYDYVARQASSRGTNLVLAPVVDVTRDPRWGRTGETWGEDPFLNGMIGTSVVNGFQGSSNGVIAPNHVACTLKHFTGHGQPEGGSNQGPSNYSIRSLREFHMEPFRMIIQNASPAAIMASYDEVDEIPSHANAWLLKDVLRKEWNYKGIVISDWFGIDQLYQKHLVAANRKEAALKAFNAGVTVDMPFGINYRSLKTLVNGGKITISAIDSTVAFILQLKFRMGLFEGKNISMKEAITFNHQTEGRKLALKIAEESMILLKNGPHPSLPPTGEGEKSLLPIGKNQYKKIAVIGPFAAVNMLGDYSGIPVKNISLLEGIKSKVNKKTEVLYAQGCRISKNADSISFNNYQLIDSIEWVTKEENERLIQAAVKTASEADFVVVAVGENEQFSREALSGHPGDISDLQLQAQQEDLVEAIAATGKPYVVYLSHGRPLSISQIAANAPAIIDGWFMGEETGNAFANILFGDVNPSGKLTISIPRSVGQIPVFYNHKPSAQFIDYVNEKKTPLYPFGYGLSYTSYSYNKPVLSGRTISVSVTNTGKRNGDEVIQMYVHQKVSSVVRPVKELKGFQRISLAAGETKTVSFDITDDLLKHWTADMKYEVEPGVYEIMIGRNSEELQMVELRVGSSKW